MKVYLFAASSCVFDCPLSMTDGAARLIEVYGDDNIKKVVKGKRRVELRRREIEKI